MMTIIVIIVVVIVAIMLQSDMREYFKGSRSGTRLHPYGFRDRSVGLYNPSIYSGYFIRKFDWPLTYTREHVRDPLRNPLFITRKYLTHGTPYQLKTQNVIAPGWNIPNIYPLVNRQMNLSHTFV